MPISNATPLIYLAKIGMLKYLKKLYKKIQIPAEVKAETVDRGIEKGYVDALLIEQALREGFLIAEKLSDENEAKAKVYADVMKIDLGEAQAIFLALQKGEREVLVDQAEVRDAARHLGLIPRGTLYLILRCRQMGFITKKQAASSLDKLVDANFHISAAIYRKAIRELG